MPWREQDSVQGEGVVSLLFSFCDMSFVFRLLISFSVVFHEECFCSADFRAGAERRVDLVFRDELLPHNFNSKEQN